MNAIFYLVYSALMFISSLTGLSYNEVNIITYYILLPFVYVVLADKILGKHVLKSIYGIAVGITLLLIPNFADFSDWLFHESVNFLLSLELFGWNYVVSSVLVCVVFPGLVLLLMLPFAYPQIRQFLRIFFSNSTDLKPNHSA